MITLTCIELYILFFPWMLAIDAIHDDVVKKCL